MKNNLWWTKFSKLVLMRHIWLITQKLFVVYMVYSYTCKIIYYVNFIDLFVQWTRRTYMYFFLKTLKTIRMINSVSYNKMAHKYTDLYYRIIIKWDLVVGMVSAHNFYIRFNSVVIFGPFVLVPSFCADITACAMWYLFVI